MKRTRTVEDALERIATAVEGGSGSGSDIYSGYDIVISTTDLDSSNVDDYVKETWDWDSIIAKLHAGKIITGAILYHYNYDDTIEGDTSIVVYQLDNMYVTTGGGELNFQRITGDNANISCHKIVISIDELGNFDNIIHVMVTK